MKAKRFLVFTGIALLMMFYAVIPASAETTTLSYLLAWPTNADESKGYIMFFEKAQKEADQKFPNQLKIELRGGPDVIHPLEQVEALRKGAISMAVSAPSYYASSMPELDLLGLTDKKPWQQRTTGLFEYVDQLHIKKLNIHYLGQTGLGVPFQICLTKPIKAVSDLKGMKIRVSPTNIPFMKAVGGVPVSMPGSDIYTAMERGVVEGYVLPVYTAKDLGLVKVTKFVVFPGLYYPTNSLLINMDVWKKLSKPLQNFLTEKAKELERVNFARTAKLHEEGLENLKKQGVKFIELSPAESKKLKAVARKALVDTVKAKSPEETKKILSYIDKMK